MGAARGAGHRRRLLARRRSTWRGALADELGFPEARFVRSNLYDLPDALDGQFDVVYTSRGVLGWLPDIRGWARVAAHFVAPGGTFFITEIHPVAQALATRASDRASSGSPTRTGSTRAADVRGQGLVRRSRPPTSASTPSTAGTTGSARS